MTHREWEAHQGLLHRCSNLKHARLTPRTERESLVFERFDATEGYGDIVVLISVLAAFAVVVVLAVRGLL